MARAFSWPLIRHNTTKIRVGTAQLLCTPLCTPLLSCCGLTSSVKTRQTLALDYFLYGDLYTTVGLIPSIDIMFGVAGDGLGNNAMTLGPIILKTTLCAIPLLVIAPLNTASNTDDDEDGTVVYNLCVQLAVDLLDTVEIIEIALDEKEHNFVEIFGAKGVFLIVRLVIVFKYKKDESILHRQKHHRHHTL